MHGRVGAEKDRTMKGKKQTDIYNAIRFGREISRIDIAKQLGLSQTCVGSYVVDLVNRGYVEEMEAEPETSKVGRQKILLKIIPEKILAIAVHINDARKVEVALVDVAGKILMQSTHESPNSAYLEMIETIKRAIDEILFKVDDKVRGNIMGIGVSVPGPVDYPDGVVIRFSSLDWDNVPLRRMLQSCYPFTVIVDNDIKAAAKHMRVYGAMDDKSDYVIFSLGEGVGTAQMIDGRISRGKTNLTGEIGHMAVDLNGPLCNCGRRGCLQALINRSHIEKMLNMRFMDAVKAYRAGSEYVSAKLDVVLNNIAMWVANIANMYDPSVLFLMGDMLDEWDELFDIICVRYKRFMWSTVAAEMQIARCERRGEGMDVLSAAANIFYKIYFTDTEVYYNSAL